jgi:hypothetical protein
MDDTSSNSSQSSSSRQRPTPTPSSPATLGRSVSFAREAHLERSLDLSSQRNAVGLGIRPLSPRRKTISEDDEQFLQLHVPAHSPPGPSPAPSVVSYPESDLSSPQFLSYTSLVQRQVYDSGNSDLREHSVLRLAVHSSDADTDPVSFRAAASAVIVTTERLMAEHIYQRAKALGWFPDAAFGVVAVRSAVGRYETFPHVDVVEGADILFHGLRNVNCAAFILTGTSVAERILRELSVESTISSESRATLTDSPFLLQACR